MHDEGLNRLYLIIRRYISSKVINMNKNIIKDLL